MLVFFLLGCLSNHQILSLSDVSGEEERLKTTQKIAQILEEAETEEQRFFALEVAAKLKTNHPKLR